MEPVLKTLWIADNPNFNEAECAVNSGKTFCNADGRWARIVQPRGGNPKPTEQMIICEGAERCIMRQLLGLTGKCASEAPQIPYSELSLTRLLQIPLAPSR